MSTHTMKIPTRRSRAASRTRREKVANNLCFILLILLGLIVIFPIYWIFRSSLMSNGELYAYPPSFVPPAWRFENYPETLKSFDYLKFLGNTMTILLPGFVNCGVPATLIKSLVAAGIKDLNVISNNTSVKGQGIGLLVHDDLIKNTYWPLILPHFCGGGAFNIFLIRQFVKTIPRELDEAAEVDGCTGFHAFWRIIFPILKPATASFVILNGFGVWNNYAQAVFFLQSRDKQNIPQALSVFFQQFGGAKWHLMASTAVIAIIPVIIIFLIFQRQFIEGLTEGAVKG